MTRPELAYFLLSDVDGVLLDGVATYDALWTQWAELHRLDPVSVIALAHGRRPFDTISEVAPHLDPDHELSLEAARLDALPPMPAMVGAHELLGALRSDRWAIVTSSREHHIRRCFDAAGLPWPGVAVFGDDVTNGKPAPDGYRLAATRLRADPRRCVVIEDSPAGVASGKAAGAMVVALTTTHVASDLRQADVVVPSLVDAMDYLRGMMRGAFLEADSGDLHGDA